MAIFRNGWEPDKRRVIIGSLIALNVLSQFFLTILQFTNKSQGENPDSGLENDTEKGLSCFSLAISCITIIFSLLKDNSENIKNIMYSALACIEVSQALLIYFLIARNKILEESLAGSALVTAAMVFFVDWKADKAQPSCNDKNDSLIGNMTIA